jgi:hypothetical protein
LRVLLRTLLLTLISVSLLSGTAAGAPPEGSEDSEAVAESGMAELLALAEITILRVSRQLDGQIARIVSELYSREQDLEISAAKGRAPNKVPPVASRSTLGSRDTAIVATASPILQCTAMPNQPLTCHIAYSRSH